MVPSLIPSLQPAGHFKAATWTFKPLHASLSSCVKLPSHSPVYPLKATKGNLEDTANQTPSTDSRRRKAASDPREESPSRANPGMPLTKRSTRNLHRPHLSPVPSPSHFGLIPPSDAVTPRPATQPSGLPDPLPRPRAADRQTGRPSGPPARQAAALADKPHTVDTGTAADDSPPQARQRTRTAQTGSTHSQHRQRTSTRSTSTTHSTSSNRSTCGTSSTSSTIINNSSSTNSANAANSPSSTSGASSTKSTRIGTLHVKQMARGPIHRQGSANSAQQADPKLVTNWIKQAPDISNLQHVVNTHWDMLDYIHMSAAIVRLADLKQQSGRDLSTTEQQLLQRLVEQQTANDWALFVTGQHPRQFANMMSSLAKLKYEVAVQDSSFWRRAGQVGCKALSWQARDQGSTPTTQNWANSLYGFALAGQYSREFCEHVEAAVLSGALDECNSQGLANTAWAFAKLGHPVQSGVLLWFQQRLLRGALATAKPQHWSNLLWGLGVMGCKLSRKFFQFLVQQVTVKRCIAGGTPQSWANMFWGLSCLVDLDDSRTHKCRQQLCAYVAEQLLTASIMQEAKPQEWSNILLAFARFRYLDAAVCEHCIKGLLDCWSQSAHGDMGDKEGQDIANSLWSLAVLNEKVPATMLLNFLLKDGSIGALAHEMTKQALCNMLWGLTVLGLRMQYKDIANVLIKEANTRHMNYEDWKTEDLVQLAQVDLAMRLQPAVAGQQWLSSELVDRGRQRAVQQVQRDSEHAKQNPSHTQRLVVTALQQLRDSGMADIEHIETEYCIPDEPLCGMLAVDVWVRLGDGREIAIEVDGPVHFMVNKPRVQDGSTLLRDRILKAVLEPKGGSVVSLHYLDIHKMHRSQQLSKYVLQQLSRQSPAET